MLLGDKWRQPEERRQFDCHKAILTSGSKSQAFVVVNISPRQSHSNGCPVGFPGESRHLSFSLVAASWTSSGCRSDHPQLLILPSGSVGTFHGGKYLHDVILTQSSFHTSPKVRNRVSDSRSCVSSHRLAFLSVGYAGFSAGNRHRCIRSICTHCQILFKNTGSQCFLQLNHVNLGI